MENNLGGYDRLAQLMGACSSVAVFRRFAALSVENLLYLQADLVRLEKQLQEVQQEDRTSGHQDRARYSFDWTLILESSSPSAKPGNDRRQLDTIMEIKARLKEYHEALFYYRQTLSLKQPHKKVLKDLRDWMESSSRGAICLIGDDGEIWNSPDASDLLTLDESSADAFTEWVSNDILDVYHDTVGRRVHNEPQKDAEKQTKLRDTILYTDKGINRITRSITIMIASMLPVVSTVVLYVIKDTPQRLGIIAGFTALFSLALGFFTNASLQDIFSATAAYAAVSVVWVGTTSTSN